MTSLRIPFVFGMVELVPTKMPPFQFLPRRSISRPKMPLLTTYFAVSALTVSVFAGVLVTVPVQAFMGAPPEPVVPAVPLVPAPPRPGGAGPGAAAASAVAVVPPRPAVVLPRRRRVVAARGARRPGGARRASRARCVGSRRARCACDAA